MTSKKKRTLRKSHIRKKDTTPKKKKAVQRHASLKKSAPRQQRSKAHVRQKYEMDVPQSILPQIHSNIPAPTGRISTKLQAFAGSILPKKIVDQRVYLVDDTGVSTVESL